MPDAEVMGPPTRSLKKLAAEDPWPGQPNAQPKTKSCDNCFDKHRKLSCVDLVHQNRTIWYTVPTHTHLKYLIRIYFLSHTAPTAGANQKNLLIENK